MSNAKPLIINIPSTAAFIGAALPFYLIGLTLVFDVELPEEWQKAIDEALFGEGNDTDI